MEVVVSSKQLITLSRYEIWSYFPRSLYFHSPLLLENTDATREIPLFSGSPNSERNNSIIASIRT